MSGGQDHPEDLQVLFNSARRLVLNHFGLGDRDPMPTDVVALAGVIAILGEHISILFSQMPNAEREIHLASWIEQLPIAVRNVAARQGGAA